MKHGVLLAALAALAVTSIAVADENAPTKFASVAAHFTATGNLKTTSCKTGNANASQGGTGANGTGGNAPAKPATPATPAAPAMTVKVKRATFSGTSTSADSRLNGSVQITLRALVSPSGLGFATGKFRVRGKIDADLTAIVSDANRLDGMLRAGHRLIANFSATFTGSTFTGDIGSGSHANTAIVSVGGCG